MKLYRAFYQKTARAIFILCSLFFISLAAPAQSSEENTTDTVSLQPMKTDEADLPDSSFIKVVVAFTVNKTGRVSDVSILENNCKGCSREMKTDLQEQVTRIIKKYPIKPKKNSQGKPVVTHYKQPIYFRIED